MPIDKFTYSFKGKKLKNEKKIKDYGIKNGVDISVKDRK